MSFFKGVADFFTQDDTEDENLEDGYAEEEDVKEDKDDLDEVVSEDSVKKDNFFRSILKKKDKSDDLETETSSKKEEPVSNRNSVETPVMRSASVRTNSRNVVQLHSSAPKKTQLVVMRPKNIEDCEEITDTLLSGHSVILNLEGIGNDIAQNIVYYCSGSSYAMRGHIKKVTNCIFIVTPKDIDISGDSQDLFNFASDSGTTYNTDFHFT